MEKQIKVSGNYKITKKITGKAYLINTKTKELGAISSDLVENYKNGDIINIIIETSKKWNYIVTHIISGGIYLSSEKLSFFKQFTDRRANQIKIVIDICSKKEDPDLVLFDIGDELKISVNGGKK